MKLKVERKWCKETYTVGRLYVDGELFSNTLEDRVIDKNKNGVFDGDEKKVYGQSAIPYGTYKVVFNHSPKFKRELPLLLDVPHFTGIRIHPGNTAADSAGCLLVGSNTAVGRLTNSRATSDRLNGLIKAAQDRGEEITIEIV